jgi:hypothetical protein
VLHSRSGRFGEENLLLLPEIEPQFLGNLGVSPSLHWLRYPASLLEIVASKKFDIFRKSIHIF